MFEYEKYLFTHDEYTEEETEEIVDGHLKEGFRIHTAQIIRESDEFPAMFMLLERFVEPKEEPKQPMRMN